MENGSATAESAAEAVTEAVSASETDSVSNQTAAEAPTSSSHSKRTLEAAKATKRSDVIEWDLYFMSVSYLSAMRSKDPSTQVGACIVNADKRIVGIGYNGFPRGCSDDELPWARKADDELDTKYPYVCHAEVNAILNKNSADVKGCSMYVALFPCNECAKMIIQSGITEVVYLSDKYRETASMRASRKMMTMAKVRAHHTRHVYSPATRILVLSPSSHTSSPPPSPHPAVLETVHANEERSDHRLLADTNRPANVICYAVCCRRAAASYLINNNEVVYTCEALFCNMRAIEEHNCSTCCSVLWECRTTRRRSVPATTVGARIGRQPRPRFCSCFAASRTAAFPGTSTPCIAVLLSSAGSSSCAACFRKSAIRPCSCSRSALLSAQNA
jgi:dCMP deaminase